MVYISKQNDKEKNPEILAPAGSQECFHAAIEAGADAIYLGVEGLNARLRAKNFTMKTLSYLIPYAHTKNVKIHVAVNIIVKQSELAGTIDILHQLQQVGADAIIVQDLGIARIARSYFPSLKLHASTQMAIHNSAGFKALESLGFTRVIPARELSMDEIKAIKQRTSLEMELFIHGALCYSISGMCLASSFLGGQSGNRGRCTQVCRRKFQTQSSGGFYFSPKDFQAIEYLNLYKEIGISSLKIEGRMRSSEYVYTVVSAYRRAMDNPDMIMEIKDELQYDFGREKTPLFLGGIENHGIITANKPSGTGVFSGIVKAISGKTITLDKESNLQSGDRIRIHGQDGLEGDVFKVASANKYLITLMADASVKKGSFVYFISRKHSESSKWNKSFVSIKPAHFSHRSFFVKKILREYTPVKTPAKHGKSCLFVKCNNIYWLPLFSSLSEVTVIIQPTLSAAIEIASRKRIQKDLVIALPHFLPQSDIEKWEHVIDQCKQKGVSKWMCSQFGHRILLGDKSICYGDSSILTMNRATQKQLTESKYRMFSYSLEDDVLNLKATGSSFGIATLFSYVPLFISRIKPAVKDGEYIMDNRNEGFFTEKHGDLFYMIGDRPFCLTHRQEKMQAMGISNFLLDFSFIPPKKKIFKTVIDAYNKKMKLPNTTLFNHKGGLK